MAKDSGPSICWWCTPMTIHLNPISQKLPSTSLTWRPKRSVETSMVPWSGPETAYPVGPYQNGGATMQSTFSATRVNSSSTNMVSNPRAICGP